MHIYVCGRTQHTHMYIMTYAVPPPLKFFEVGVSVSVKSFVCRSDFKSVHQGTIILWRKRGLMPHPTK